MSFPMMGLGERKIAEYHGEPLSECRFESNKLRSSGQRKTEQYVFKFSLPPDLDLES